MPSNTAHTITNSLQFSNLSQKKSIMVILICRWWKHFLDARWLADDFQSVMCTLMILLWRFVSYLIFKIYRFIIYIFVLHLSPLLIITNSYLFYLSQNCFWFHIWSLVFSFLIFYFLFSILKYNNRFQALAPVRQGMGGASV